MERPRTREALIEAFRALGVPEPEDWADSELESGINQLGRAAFLSAAWQRIVSERDLSWVDAELKGDTSEFGSAQSLRRILQAGASREDLAYFVRVMQHNLLFDLCHILDSRSDLPIRLGLFELDAAGNPVSPVEGLHESTLEMDPEGLELGSIRELDHTED